MGFLGGIPFFLGIFAWVLTVGKYALLHHGILEIYLWCYFGLFGLTFVYINTRIGPAAALACAPFVWITLEYVRSNFFFLALPWGVLGFAHFENHSFIQIASLVGTYGISFLVVLTNSALAAVIIQLLDNRFLKQRLLNHSVISKSFTILLSVLTLVAVSGTLLYGSKKMSTDFKDNSIKVSIIQGNIEQSKKWDKKYAAEIMQIYSDMTMKASRVNPDLIVWPETATPWALNLDPRLRKQIEGIARSANSYLLLGSAQAQKFKLDDPKSAKFKNSAYLVSADGKLTDTRYDKIYLLPFGEYIPYKEKIPWHLLKVPEIGSYIPGTEFTVFETPIGRFSTTICWENAFSEIFRKFVKNGAQLMVNITNEAWFGPTSAPYHFLSMSVLRAVENRVFVIRCANTGVSCFIDPCGRIADRVRGQDGSDIFVRGILTNPVSLSNSETLYTRHGEFFPKFCIVVTFGFILIALFLKRLKKNLR